MRKETPRQFAARVAEFESDLTTTETEIEQPEEVTWQLITAGENARARQIAAECKAESLSETAALA